MLDTSREDNHSGPFVLWNLNLHCNYRCRYCFYSDDQLSKEHPAVGKHSIGHITNCFDKTGKQWWIFLSGGEPFLYPRFVDLCKSLTKQHYITINTNCSTTNVKKFAHEIDPEKVYSINGALHIEQREQKKGALDRYIENVLLFQEKGFQFRVEYVMYPALFDRVEEDIAYLHRCGVKIVNIKVFKGKYKGKRYPLGYNSEERVLLEKYTLDKNELRFTEDKMSYKGKLCRAGYEFFRMDQAGDVYRCNSSAVKMGNFFEESEVLYDKAMPCVLNRCMCQYEGLKYGTEEKSELIPLVKEVVKEYPSYMRRKYSPQNIIRALKVRWKMRG